MSLSEVDAAELRGTMTSPGWEVATRILHERLELVKRLLLVDEVARPKGLSDSRLRGEALVLTLFLTKPAELLEQYDNLVREELQEPMSDAWMQAALAGGMRFAGFPQADNPRREPE